MQLQVSQGHIKINKFICGNCMFNIIIRLSVCRPEKKKKGGHNFYIYIYIYIYIYYTTTTTTSASNPTPPPQKDLLKSWTDKQMMTHMITLSTRLSRRKKLKLHQWGCCVPSVWLQHTRLRVLLSLPTIYQISTTSWACYEQDFVSIYLFMYSMLFSPLMSLCFGWKPHHTHMGKKIKKKKKKRVSIRMQ